MIKLSGIKITGAKAGLDELPFSNLLTERVDFQFSEDDMPQSRLDIKQLIENLKELKARKATIIIDGIEDKKKTGS